MTERLLPRSVKEYLQYKLIRLLGKRRLKVKPYETPSEFGNRLDLIVFSGKDATRSGIDATPHPKWERCFWIASNQAPSLRETNDRFFQCRLDPSDHEKSGLFLYDILRSHAVEEAVVVVQDPCWIPLALRLKERFGWKIVGNHDATGYGTAGYDKSEYDATGCDTAGYDKSGCDATGMETGAPPSDAASPARPGWDLFLDHTPALTLAEMDDRFWNSVVSLYDRASIIIISFNGLEVLEQCIRSILDRTVYPNFEIIVVDNASREEVRTYLADLDANEPRLKAIFNDTNLGFPAANNIGFDHIGNGRFIVMLNNDTVAPRGWLCRLLRNARREDVGIVGPVTNWTGNEARIDVTYTDLKDMEPFARSYTSDREGRLFDIPMLAMFCVAMRREVLDKVGRLDERFGMGMFEDQDYARRIREAGYRVVCAEDAFIHHYGMASFFKLKSRVYRELFEKNRKLYEDKWQESWIPHKRKDG